jgi:hypothetical protein
MFVRKYGRWPYQAMVDEFAAAAETRVIMTLEGHEPYINEVLGDLTPAYTSYFLDREKMIADLPIRPFDDRTCRRVRKLRTHVRAVVVSRDSQSVVAAGIRTILESSEPVRLRRRS